MISTAANLQRPLSLAPALDACGTEPKAAVTVRIKVSPRDPMLCAARSLGFFDRHPMKTVAMPASAQTALALLNGFVDVTGLLLDKAPTLLQSKPSLRAMLVMDRSKGVDGIRARPDLDSLEKLKGQCIGVNRVLKPATVAQAFKTEETPSLSAARLCLNRAKPAWDIALAGFESPMLEQRLLSRPPDRRRHAKDNFPLPAEDSPIATL